MIRSCVRKAATGRNSLRRASLAALAVTMTSTSGCYQYLPAQIEPAPPVGEDVRLVVSREGATDLAAITDLSNSAVPLIEGRLESAEPGTFMVRVPLPPTDGQPGVFNEVGQLIRVPTNQILGIERREFDPVMSGIVVAGVVAGGTVLLLRIIDAVGSDNSGGNPDPVLQLRVPFGFGIGR